MGTSQIHSITDARECLSAWWQYTAKLAPAPTDPEDLRAALRRFSAVGDDLVGDGLAAIDVLVAAGQYQHFVNEHSVRLRVQKKLGLDGERAATGFGWLAADMAVGAVPPGGLARFHLAARGRPSWRPAKIENHGVAPAEIDTILAIFNTANGMAVGLRPPKNLVVEVKPTSDRLAFDGFWCEISTACRYTFKREGVDDYHQSPEATLVMTAHEYGHALFNENTPIRSQYTAVNGRTIGEVRRVRLAVHEHQSALYRELAKKSLPSEHKQQLEAELEEANELRSILDGELDRAARIFKPYNELFADVVAVLVARDGAAVADAVSPPQVAVDDDGREQQKRNHMLRDFTRDLPVDGWEYEVSRNDASHYILAPTRSHLWKSRLRRCIETNKPGNVLRDLLRTIIAVVEANPQGYKNQSAEQLNRDLVEAIEKRQ